MNYEKIYQNICQRGIRRKKIRGGSLEKHHIVPVFFYKNNKRKLRHNDGIYEGDGEHVGNITYLTPKEHFIAHLILCKIWNNTKWEYRCYLSLKMFLNGGPVNNKRSVYNYSSRIYEKYKIQTNKAISKGKTGTMPAKNLLTGERLGIVSMNDPKVLNGEWVHITKGLKKTAEQNKIRSNESLGYANQNSKYSDTDLLESYKNCCYKYNKLVNGSFWVQHSVYYNLPHLKHWKMFRFSNRGFWGMVDELIKCSEKDGITLEKYNSFHSNEWRQFTKKETKNWV